MASGRASMLRGDNLKKLYRVYEKVYFHYTRRKWEWKPGFKQKAKLGFNRFRAILEEDGEPFGSEAFDEILKFYYEYLMEAAEKWLKWNQSNWRNFLGYLISNERQEMWYRRLMYSDAEDSVMSNTKDDWDF